MRVTSSNEDLRHPFRSFDLKETNSIEGTPVKGLGRRGLEYKAGLDPV